MQSSIESSTEIQADCQKLLVLTTLLESGLPHSKEWNLDFCSIEVGLEASVQGLQLVMGLSKTLPLLAEQVTRYALGMIKPIVWPHSLHFFWPG